MLVTDAVSIVCICVLYIMGSIGIFWCWSYITCRQKVEIASRRPHSAILAGILCIMGLLIEWPLVLASFNISFIIPPDNEEMEWNMIIPTNLLSIIVINGTFHIFTYRAWLVYFDMNWNQAMIDAQWRLHINPNETNWWLKHRKTWGNSVLIAFILCADCVIWFIIVGVLTWTKNRREALLSQGVAPIISLIIDFTILLKFPKTKDVFSVSNEIRLGLVMELTLITIYYGVVMLFTPQWHTLGYISIPLIGGVTHFGFICIAFLYPLHRFKYLTNPCALFRKESYDAVRVLSVGDAEDANRKVGHHYGISLNSLSNRQIFTEIMKSHEAFNAYAHHLTKEFCLENLLFFIETQQWIQSLAKKQSYVEYVEDEMYRSDLYSIELTKQLPRSEIVGKELVKEDGTEKALESLKTLGLFNPSMDTIENKVNQLPSTEEYVQCSKLFTKYASNNAHFCINISYIERKQLYIAFGYTENRYDALSWNPKDYLAASFESALLQQKNKMTKKVLFHIFDDARASIYYLLLQALSRFKLTPAYRQLQEHGFLSGLSAE
eukprot:252001_1